MGKALSIVASLAIVSGTLALVVNARAERRLNAMAWQYFVWDAQMLADEALSMEPAAIEAANHSAIWFGMRCQAVARTTLADPETGIPVNVVLSFVGHCHQGMPVGAVVLQARNQGQAGGNLPNVSGMSLPASDLTLGLIGAENRSGADVVAAVRTHMDRLLEIKPIQAGALPAWPEGADSPAMPNGLQWRGTIQRNDYEAMRAANGLTVCLHTPVLYCGARRPAGQPGLVQVAAVEGLMIRFGLPRQADAVDVLTGAGTAPGEQEQAAFRDRQHAAITAAIESHLGMKLQR